MTKIVTVGGQPYEMVAIDGGWVFSHWQRQREIDRLIEAASMVPDFEGDLEEMFNLEMVR